MRYEDWDILLFPLGNKVPMREFKVGCHVVPDTEFSHTNGSFGLPTMTCFIPSLPVGAPFYISVHAWSAPEISQLARTYSNHPELVKFEVRILVDGELVGSTSFDQKIHTDSPKLIHHSFEFTKNGDLEPLKFPPFHQELLHQNFWNPADDIGRIKLIISEGFPRDSLSMPIERVKNIAAFSFQHAPLEILESSAIAWPNPAMWRRAPQAASMPVPNFPSNDGAESHAHSPRRRADTSNRASHSAPPSGFPGSSTQQSNPAIRYIPPILPRNIMEKFIDEQAYYDWLASTTLGMPHCLPPAGRHPRKVSSSDTSMPDYASSHHSGRMSLSMSDPLSMPLPLPPLTSHAQPQAQNQNIIFDDEDHGSTMKAPTNTPTGGHDSGDGNLAGPTFQSTIPTDLASSLTNSLLCQSMPYSTQPHDIPLPASEVKSRKENRLGPEASFFFPSAPGGSSQGLSVQVASTQVSDHVETRKVSQPLFGLIGAGMSVGSVPANTHTSATSQPVADGSTAASVAVSAEQTSKRRNLTPASTRAIDADNEPRHKSPMVRTGPVELASENQK